MEELVLMPIEVPSNPKIYTTKYDNFRGVDFTNDPSNVWNHRSPNAVNMMPDMAGRPWKRTGWEIMKSAQDFRDCYNTAMGYVKDVNPEYYEGKIVPIKTNYFEIGGEDYLAVSNNLGLFFYSKFIGTSAKDEPDLIYIDGYYGEVGTATESTKTLISIAPDANRAFFFEGQGLAGFYIFCTTTDTSTPPNIETHLFRFDGEKLRKVEPRVPLIMIGKEAGDSAGTLYESPNILTTERICQFFGDGQTADFVLPERANISNDVPFSVQILSSGVWTDRTKDTHYTITDPYNYAGQIVTKITFTAGNIPIASTEDNVKVRYSVQGDVPSTTTFNSVPSAIKFVTTTPQTRTITYEDDKATSITPWVDGASSTTRTKAEWAIPNILVEDNEPKVDVYMQTAANTWAASPVLKANILTLDYTAYSNTLAVDLIDFTSYYHNHSEEFTNPTRATVNVRYSRGEVIRAQGYVTRAKTRIKTVNEKRYKVVTNSYPVKVEATQRTYTNTKDRVAFESCNRAIVYGNGLINSVFVSGSTSDNYRSRVWWSYPTDPSYFPDINYLEAGSNDTNIAGMMKVGEYLGIIKQGTSFDSTIYLAFQTQFKVGDDYEDTYAIKSSIGGIGAISNGAFNILNDEPLFLSRDGIMGINPTNEADKQLRNRSFFINKKLMEEGSLENAFSFVYKNMYILCVNNHCYVLDGSQKTSWANEKTNLQYECYYWDNVPAQCFARYNNELWFTDKKGRLCRFKPVGTPSSYHDDYDPNLIFDENGNPYTDDSTDIVPWSIVCSNDDLEIEFSPATWWTHGFGTGQFVFTFGSAGYLHRTLLGHDLGNSGHWDINAYPRTGTSIVPYIHNSEGWHLNGEPISLSAYGITMTGNPIINDTIVVCVGNPINAKWATVFDDDGAAHYFKNLQKKGTMVALLPDSSTGVKVYLVKDNEDKKYLGTATVRGSGNEVTAPSDFYLRKKAKRYKRLQIIAENDGFDENFGIDEIIKCYTVGNYSRNR